VRGLPFRIPRSAIVLVILLLAAVTALTYLRGRDGRDATLGGRLFDLDPGEIEGLLVARPGLQIRLARSEDGFWSLGGDVSDHVEQGAVTELLRAIVLAQGGPLLAGTEPEDRRFEFNGPSAIRLTVFATGREPLKLALGTGNPVSGLFYASGVGRPGSFQVPAEFRQALDRLPYDVQARQLLPDVERGAVTGLTLGRRDRDFELRRLEGRWWIAVPPEGPGFFGPLVADYHRYYGDRIIRADGRDWALADPDRVANQIYEVSDTIVRRILPSAEGAAQMAAWELAPPWRTVTLHGSGLDADPTAEDADRLELGFGPYLGEDGVPVLRRGNVLLTDVEAIGLLEQSVRVFAHRRALDVRPLDADRFELRREGRLLVAGERTGQAATDEGREAWITVFPPADEAGVDEKIRQGLVRDLVVNLGRLEILQVLPPMDDPAVLTEKEKVTITLTWGTGANAQETVMDIGRFDRDRLAARGVEPREILAAGAAGTAGFLVPASGQFFQISGQILVTARNLVAFAGPE
jgi:hypothetical protein